MTFEERLAELGVELRDLDSVHFYRRTMSIYEKFIDIANEKAKKIDGEVGVTLAMVFIDAINERDDIIDRMETRLVNVISEREYLLDRMWGENPCVICENAKRYGGCAVDICEFEFAGVPEDWMAHDD